MEEIWKDIPEYESIYQASNFGRIRTAIGKTTYTKKHGVRHWKSRILKGRGDNRITGKRVSLWKDGKCKEWLVARLVAITFLGYPIGDKNTVNHINGNRLDNRIENLEWLSSADNIRHAFANGLMPYKKVVLTSIYGSVSYPSMTKASISLGKSHNFIFDCIKHNKKNIIVNDIEYKISF